MDNKLYCLWNYDEDRPVYISHDKTLLQEYMTDMFLFDAYYQFCWDAYSEYSEWRVDAGTPIEEIAKNAWDSTQDWYDNYMFVLDLEEYMIE